jgi:hypothetical protein
MATTGTPIIADIGTTAMSAGFKTTTKLSNPFKGQCQQSWLFFQWEECLAQLPGGDWLATISPFKTSEKKGRKHLVAIGTRSPGRDQASL